MPLCASVKNAKSTEQCPSRALLGHTLCGRHRGVRTLRLWVDVNKSSVAPALRIQSVFRAWKVRRYLALCGPGVLRRAACVNDEDVCTTVEKTRQYPLDYFGLEEGGKVWWFDFCTIWDWASRSIAPLNPYTNVPLTAADLHRLKKLWIQRRRNHYEVPSETGVPTADRVTRRWTILCQVFRFYGFEDTHPNMFADLTKENFAVMFSLIYRDITEMPRPSQRALVVCRRGMTNANTLTAGSYMMTSLNGLLFMLMDSNAYDFVFLALSALYRC